MQLIILAAGRGTRMKELTDQVPKPMLEINGKPILACKLEALPGEIDEVVFVIGYLGNQIQKYFGDFYAGKKISYVVQEELNGTGGALHAARDVAKEDFLVMMGDDLYAREDIEKIMKFDLAIVGMENLNSKRFGVITLNGEGNLKETIENLGVQGTILENTGLYKLNRKFFDYPLVKLEGKNEMSLPQGLSLMAKDYPVRVEKASGWFPIGSPDDLEKAKTEIIKFV